MGAVAAIDGVHEDVRVSLTSDSPELPEGKGTIIQKNSSFRFRFVFRVFSFLSRLWRYFCVALFMGSGLIFLSFFCFPVFLLFFVVWLPVSFLLANCCMY